MMISHLPRMFVSSAAGVFLISPRAMLANETPKPLYEIRFEHHHFTERRVVIPAGRQLRIEIVNASAEQIEFESFKLNREKIVESGQRVTLNLSALKAGHYDFFDDFHTDVPAGEIVAVDQDK